ncbi:MAG: 3,4-dihydroxy-2-butanone-4-phosphate synthase [Dehalococcoidia bacterium]
MQQQPSRTNFSDFLSPTEELLEEARNGRMVVVVDDEDRENEGDLIIPAQMATPDAVNFMAKYGRGLICLAMTRERVEQLGLRMMAQDNRSRNRTAFTVSIEAKEGISTGISAADRALTVAVAVDPSKGADDIVSPGHVFPLVARDGGVLVRAGHTEASVDFARMAGLLPAAVICEIMNDDGTMARLPDLIAFAQRHNLKVGTIADLIGFRRRTENLVERAHVYDLDSAFGGLFKLYVYVDTVTQLEHLALVKGDVSGPEPVLVRVHASNVIEDVLGDVPASRAGLMHRAMRLIGEHGRGVVVFIREGLQTSLSDRLRERLGAPRKERPGELRHYGVGAQILLDLGVKDMILLSNSQRTIVGLEGYGLRIIGQRPIPPGPTA